LIKLDVPVFGQREAECGNASLKAVLWFLGRRVSAAHLARVAGTTPDGIDHAALVEAARGFGTSVFSRASGSITELRWFLTRGHPLIVGWWSQDPGDAHHNPAWSLPERRARDCGHYSVICGIDATRVLMMDPQWEMHRGRLRIMGRRWMPISRFRRVWYDTDTDAYRKVERWYMVVHRSHATFAARFKGGEDHPPMPRS
jgi:hypothetical protein